MVTPRFSKQFKNREASPKLEGLQLQSEFLRRVHGVQQVQHLFEDLPGIFFFVKDLQSRMISASQPIVERLGLTSEAQLIGTTDYDHFPKHVADSFVRDDQTVISTGQPLIHRVEVWYNEQRLLDWFLTNKLPVRDSEGQVIGVMGTVRSYEGQRRSLIPYSQIDRVVDYVRAHHRQRLTVVELARHAELSPRQLHRRFREVFGMNVQEFLGKTRLHAACDELMKTRTPISEVALMFGYCDQSAFTQHFRKHLGMTPLQFRKRHSREIRQRST